MRKRALLLLAILSCFAHVACKAQTINPCLKFQKQAVDSLTSYYLSFNKKKSALVASLHLVDKAINCDSTYFSAWREKITILSVMEEYRRAIEVTDEYFRRFPKDSGFLVHKPALYESLNLYDSAKYLNGRLNLYFKARLKNDPEDDGLIYHYLFTKFKVLGWEAVREEIEWYKKKYPNNANLIAILGSIHP